MSDTLQFSNGPITLPAANDNVKDLNLRVHIDSDGNAALSGDDRKGIGAVVNADGNQPGVSIQLFTQGVPIVRNVSGEAIPGNKAYAAAGGGVAPTGSVEVGVYGTAIDGTGDVRIIQE